MCSHLINSDVLRVPQTGAQRQGALRIAIGAGLAIWASACAAGSLDLVGATVPPLPVGWHDDGGMCITSRQGQEQACEFSLGVVKKGLQRLLYIGKAQPRIDANTLRWLVTDQMAYPLAPKGFQVVITPCQRDGQPAETTVAIVRSSNSEWYERVRAAYRANLATGLFETVTSQGMRCLNEGWGI